jgi:Bacterial EndoU nuclease
VITGVNAAENNYLKHAEALRLQALQDQKARGQCAAQCQQDIQDLQALSKLRDERLAACDGNTSVECNTARQEVRSAAAEYIRKNITGLPNTLTLDTPYQNERADTLQQADATLNGSKTLGAVQGAADTIADGIVALGKLLLTTTGSAFGDTQSQLDLRNGAGAAWDFVKDPANWPQILGAMGASDRENLARAYEAGDGTAVGRIMGAQILNLPGGGGAAGTIKKIDKFVVAAEDVAKAGSKLPNSPVDIAHTIGADYNARTGKVTGGHSTLNGDVRVTEVVSAPDANGVYEAVVELKTPAGEWVEKTNYRGEIQTNTMFPKNWDAAKIQAEVDSAWADPKKSIDPTTGKWKGKSNSGVDIEGYSQPIATAYPIYGNKK